MPVNIHAKELPLKDIFDTRFAFHIPRYQRPYAWTTEQAGELLSDVMAVLDKERVAPLEVSPYFLGSIVLIKTDDDPRADVVDGQQRLTTLTILLAALRESVASDVRDQVTEYLYQKGNSITDTPAAYRLKLRERDEQFFRETVQDDGGLANRLPGLKTAKLPDSQRNVRDNALFYLDALAKLSPQQRDRLLKYLMNRCFLVTVTTPDFDSAYRIFSVLNTRGMQLGLTDLLKSDIIGALPESLQDQYTELWEATEEGIGRDAFQELFAHIRMIRRRVKASETTLKEFQTHIKPADAPRDFLDQTLRPYADAFADIRGESYSSTSNANEINALFGWLNQIDNFDWVPPAIAFLAANRNDPARLERFFADLERLAAALMIRRANINARLDRYGRVLVEIKDGADLFRADSPLQLSDTEKDDVVARLGGNLYEEPFAKYVLLRLDAALSSGGATYTHKIISIEHVLPQNPPANSEWIRWFTPVERESWVHRLGNLTLLSRRKNSQAQNYDFGKKKDKYFYTDTGTSPFQLTTQVLGRSDWTPAVLQSRQTQLINTLKQTWRL